MKPGPSVRRLHDGSVLVAQRIGRGFVPEGQPLAALIRCGGALWISGRVLTLLHQSPLWLVGGTCAWCVAAWRAEPDQTPTTRADPTAEPAHTDAEIYASAVEHLQTLIGDRNGVHLSEILTTWQTAGWVGQIPAAELGRQLQRRGIPIRSSIKVAGATNAGVHRDDLPAAAEPLPQPLPDPALADAG